MQRIPKSNIRIILEASEAAWTETSEDELRGVVVLPALAGRGHRCEGVGASS